VAISTQTANPNAFGASASVPTSAKGAWVTVHANAASAQSASDIYTPGAVTSANVIAIPLAKGTTRCFIRCRYANGATVTTSPVIRIISAYGAGLISTTFPTDGTVKYLIAASAQTLTCTSATDIRDGTYSYSALHSTTGTDLLGADYLIVFVETASSITGATQIIEALLTN